MGHTVAFLTKKYQDWKIRKATFTAASHTGINFLFPMLNKIIYQVSIAMFTKIDATARVMIISFKKGTGIVRSLFPDRCLLDSISFRIR